MKKQAIIYDGLSVKVYSTEDPEKVVISFTDDISAFSKVKRAKIEGKAKICNSISSLVFNYLASNGIKTHFIEQLSSTEQLCKRIEAIPIHVVVRNIVAGSMARQLGFKEGYKPSHPIIDLRMRNEALNHPLINDSRATALGLVTEEELDEIYEVTTKINNLLIELCEKAGMILVDYKIQYGRLPDGSLVMNDDINPDSARFWDKETNKKLDRDRFRTDSGKIAEAYQVVQNRLEAVLNAETK